MKCGGGVVYAGILGTWVLYDTFLGKMHLFKVLTGAKGDLRVGRHSPLARGVNILGRLVFQLTGKHLVSLDPLQLKKEAAEAADLCIDELTGDLAAALDSTDEQLHVLVEAAERAFERDNGARLSMMGRLAIKQEIISALKNRLQLAQYVAKHPDVLETDVSQFGPLIVLGMPRTGTTLLHLLLSLDPRNRSFAPWEMRTLVPPAERDTYAQDPRIAFYASQMEGARLFFPGVMADLFANHIHGDTFPEECILLHANALHNFILALTLKDDRYYDSVNHSDSRTALHDYHKRQVQLLLHKYKPEQDGHIVLKAPSHSIFIDELMRIYPKCKFVFTHRNPVSVVPSAAKILHPINEMYGEAIDLASEGRLAQHVCEDYVRGMATLREACNLPMCSSKDIEEGKMLHEASPRAFDVHIDEMKANALGVVERIYEHFGMGPLLPEHSRRIKEVLENDAKLRANSAPSSDGIRYDLHSTWSLTAEDLGKTFQEYNNSLQDHF